MSLKMRNLGTQQSIGILVKKLKKRRIKKILHSANLSVLPDDVED